MSARQAAWPMSGQALGAALTAIISLAVYLRSSDAVAAGYFSVAAAVSFTSTIGSFGQRRLLPRDIRVSADAGVVSLLKRRLLKLVPTSLFAAVVAVVGSLALRSYGVGTPAFVGVIAAWVIAESYRGVLADAHLGFHLDRRAALTGDALRATAHCVALGVAVLLSPSVSLFALVAIGCLGSVLAAGVSAGSLSAVVARLDDHGVAAENLTLRRTGLTMMAAELAAALTTQATVVVGGTVFVDGEAAAFALALRIALALTIVQAGTAKFVLPRAVGLGSGQAGRAGLLRTIRTVTWFGVAAAASGLFGVLAVVRYYVDGQEELATALVPIGVGYLLNIAAGPSGTILVANGYERIVLASNAVFGTVAVTAPLLTVLGVPFWVSCCMVGVSVALHHGLLAQAVYRLLGFSAGLWRVPFPTRR